MAARRTFRRAESQLFLFFVLKRATFNLWTSSVAALKVGMTGSGFAASLASRFASTGSTPSLIIWRCFSASLRASPSPTKGYPPKPMFLRFPSNVARKTHDFAPESLTLKVNPSPSAYVPGEVMALTFPAVS